jgi:hypothetical protein
MAFIAASLEARAREDGHAPGRELMDTPALRRGAHLNCRGAERLGETGRGFG